MNITINGKKINARPGQTILEAAKAGGIEIPTLCYHPDLDVKANCRVCAVEVKGRKGLLAACSTKAEPGMEILIDSEKAKAARKTNLELLFGEHHEKCPQCVKRLNCQLLKLGSKYGAKINKYPDRKKNYKSYEFGPSVVYDSSKCIECKNCVEACRRQGVNFFDVVDNPPFAEVEPTRDKKRDCIYCGQCLAHCPVGAFHAGGEFEDTEKPFLEKGKTIVVQFAPAIRVSIGDEFGLKPGSIVTDQLSAAIRKLGVCRVFDVSVGADFTTMEEAAELAHKIKKGHGACLTSCCPSWVKFVEFYYPEFTGCLATTRSPQIINGMLIKKYWAKKEGIDPKKITVISIMPCTSKKYEIQRPELKIDGIRPVDYVLTTRELAYLLKKKNIDLKNIKPEPADNPFGLPSGAGVIFGASGGVAESALRTAYYLMTGKNPPKIDVKEIRGLQGIKKAKIKLKGKTLKMAVVSGTGNAAKILEELKKNPKAYNAVEVMACPGGCVGGGGQPLPNTPEIRELRAQALYQIDVKDKMRMAHENPVIKRVYKEFLTSKKIRHKLCHTTYSAKKREVHPVK